MPHDGNATASGWESDGQPLTSLHCLGIAVASALVGLWSGHRVYGVLTAGDPVRMMAGDLEWGTGKPGVWNEISGVLLLDSVCVHRSRRSMTYYIPLVSPAWKRGEEIAAVARFSQIPQDARGGFRGITPTHHGSPHRSLGTWPTRVSVSVGTVCCSRQTKRRHRPPRCSRLAC